ncbi:hypothetical protein FOBRF1_014681 [Fusarium oxysporum]
MCVAWERLIRFVADDGRTLYGEPILPSADFDIRNTDEKTLLRARVLEGQDIYDTTGATKLTDEIVTVQTLFGPLTPADVPGAKLEVYVSGIETLKKTVQFAQRRFSRKKRPSAI